MAMCERCNGSRKVKIHIAGQGGLCPFCRSNNEFGATDTFENTALSRCECDPGHDVEETCPRCKGTGQEPEPVGAIKKR